MKRMQNLLTIYMMAAATVLSGCSTNAGTTEEGSPITSSGNNTVANPKPIVHYNIIFTPDFSNRLTKTKPVSDQQIVASVLDNIYPTILKNGRTVNQYDIFSTSIMSNQLITQHNVNTQNLLINFAKFGNRQKERINYITGKATDYTLEKDKRKFLQELKNVYDGAAKKPAGADVWSYFSTGISNTLFPAEIKPSSFNKITYTNEYRNIMILLTDGYIEASMYGKKACPSGNQCYYLSGEKIKEFRKAYIKSGLEDLKEFYKKNNYGIVPVKNKNLENLEILVLQMEDRSLNNSGNATVYPTDMEIMDLFWRDWLSKSGVKRFDLKPALSSVSETEKVILDFMGIN